MGAASILLLWLMISNCLLPTFSEIQTVLIDVQNNSCLLSGYENDIVFRHISKHQWWDVEVIELAKALLPLGTETIFDIGANLGFMSLHFSYLVGSGNVYSWEPHPSNYHLLERNIKDNKRINIQPFNNAVSDEVMTLCIPEFADVSRNSTLYRKKTNNGDIKLSDKGFKNQRCHQNEIPIETMQLKGLGSQIQRLDFIKIGTVVFLNQS